VAVCGVASDRLLFMLMVPIQVASQRSGVTAHVIRIWERRYGALAPSRTGTNRRMYSDEEVLRLRLLKELTERGHRIGGIAELPTEALEGLLQGDRQSAERTFAVDVTPEITTPEQYVEGCLAAAKGFEAERLRRLLQRARLQFGQRGMLRQVITPLIGHLGVSWQDGHLRSGQEHLGTAIIREVLMTPVPGSQTATNAPELVIATPSGEIHELGALLVAASARDLGWRVTYLGPNLPAEEIAACARARNVKAAAVSVVYPEKCSTVLNQLRELRKLLPEGIAMIVGGRTAAGYRAELGDLAIEWAEDLAGLDRMLVSLERQG
jgi:DNA-binding transcriptional MerR regulator/methylmalonyl-CoA mutase cobalamin-binding subunit